jgi:hypothetical protein
MPPRVPAIISPSAASDPTVQAHRRGREMQQRFSWQGGAKNSRHRGRCSTACFPQTWRQRWPCPYRRKRNLRPTENMGTSGPSSDVDLLGAATSPPVCKLAGADAEIPDSAISAGGVTSGPSSDARLLCAAPTPARPASMGQEKTSGISGPRRRGAGNVVCCGSGKVFDRGERGPQAGRSALIRTASKAHSRGRRNRFFAGELGSPAAPSGRDRPRAGGLAH